MFGFVNYVFKLGFYIRMGDVFLYRGLLKNNYIDYKCFMSCVWVFGEVLVRWKVDSVREIVKWFLVIDDNVVK